MTVSAPVEGGGEIAGVERDGGGVVAGQRQHLIVDSALASMVLLPVPVAIVSPGTAAVVTLSVPVSAAALRSPCRPLTVKLAGPTRLEAQSSASALALTLMASSVPPAASAPEVMVVALQPVVMPMSLASTLSVVVTLRSPASTLASRSPLRPVTVTSAAPASVRLVPSGSAAALTAMASPPSVPVIEMVVDPVVTVLMLLPAPPTVTVSAPLELVAVRSPR